MGADINSVDWADLTRMPTKSRIYRRETYFREGLRDTERVLGDRAGEVLRRHALLMVKPDGIAAGKVGAVLDYLSDQGFAVQGVRLPVLHGQLWREMWRYQLTSATIDRLGLNDLIYVGAGLMLLLRDQRPGPLPATMRLASLKGSADLSKQKPGTLRDLLGQRNRNFSYIHVADEPADLVRELGLLLDPAQRLAALAGLAAEGPGPDDAARLDEVLTAERAAVAHRSFATDAATDAVLDALKRSEHGDRAIRLLERMRLGEPVAWIEVAEAVHESGAAVDRWDLATVGASLITCDEPGETKLIANPEPDSWA
jgi:nucleoside diphosphate kinase